MLTIRNCAVVVGHVNACSLRARMSTTCDDGCAVTGCNWMVPRHTGVVHLVCSSMSSPSCTERRCSTRSWPGAVSERPRRVHDDENSHQQRLVVVLQITQADTNHQAIYASTRFQHPRHKPCTQSFGLLQCRVPILRPPAQACSPSSMPPYDWSRTHRGETASHHCFVIVTGCGAHQARHRLQSVAVSVEAGHSPLQLPVRGTVEQSPVLTSRESSPLTALRETEDILNSI